MRSLQRFLELNFNYFLRGRVPTLVFSMRRSGSIALFRSLCAHGDFVVAVHQMNPKLRQSGSTKWAYRHLVRKRKPVKIISLVRDPIENMLSNFARLEFSKNIKDQQAANTSGEEPTAEEFSHQFKTDYLDKQLHLQQLEWFESEFKATLGIDVYSHPFDREKGMTLIQDGFFKVLILRTELDDDQKSQEVSEFLGLTGFKMLKPGEKLKTGNDMAPGMPGELTKHGSKYRAFKQKVFFPDESLEAIINSRYVQHFFSQEECDAMKERFKKPTSALR